MPTQNFVILSEAKDLLFVGRYRYLHGIENCRRIENFYAYSNFCHPERSEGPAFRRHAPNRPNSTATAQTACDRSHINPSVTLAC
jgi:hypothetical protein